MYTRTSLLHCTVNKHTLLYDFNFQLDGKKKERRKKRHKHTKISTTTTTTAFTITLCLSVCIFLSFLIFYLFILFSVSFVFCFAANSRRALYNMIGISIIFFSFFFSLFCVAVLFHMQRSKQKGKMENSQDLEFFQWIVTNTHCTHCKYKSTLGNNITILNIYIISLYLFVYVTGWCTQIRVYN